MNSYADLFEIISQHPHSRTSLKARKFIMSQISEHRLTALKSKGNIKRLNNRYANNLEKRLYESLEGKRYD